MNQKELAYQTISDLVTRFDEQFESYKNSGYNETLTPIVLEIPESIKMGSGPNNA